MMTPGEIKLSVDLARTMMRIKECADDPYASISLNSDECKAVLWAINILRTEER